MSSLNNLASVGQVIVVLSGKGGVGKSTVAVQLALSLVSSGKQVGLLDLDICGPSVPHMLGLEGKDVHQSEQGWLPVYTSADKNLAVMSIAFLLKNKNDAVIWRGPKKHAMIKQFIQDVCWDQLDYLIIDTPPGTSDEHMTLLEILKESAKGAVLVTTPNLVAISDVRREVTFCEKTGLKIIGLVENMSGFVCPNCQDCSQIFPTGGGQLLADETGIPLLGKIPIDPNLVRCEDKGENFIAAFGNSPAALAVHSLRDTILSKLISIPSPMDVS
ncbi:unnamed protein product [Orchesella dallaii]|uniref:Cytosolic Fe-S cluster assembly factor NUBP2 homolog n=1 Tax=Orchesella dallaii TaxID=48710 RepID=A0ABP1Q7Z2_9HEXA